MFVEPHLLYKGQVQQSRRKYEHQSKEPGLCVVLAVRSNLEKMGRCGMSLTAKGQKEKWNGNGLGIGHVSLWIQPLNLEKLPTIQLHMKQKKIHGFQAIINKKPRREPWLYV
ncbi:MAG: hypothetical protein EOP06_11225 [Proteobacteria bacterium]|nr:MAG: hypothetical protein EOP06_11225 [Pseudomonadota bacterium]